MADRLARAEAIARFWLASGQVKTEADIDRIVATIGTTAKRQHRGLQEPVRVALRRRLGFDGVAD